MEQDKRSYWYNYVTGDYEYRAAPETDDDAKSLLPQIPAAQGLYTVLREMDNGILDSMIKVLTACVGGK